MERCGRHPRYNLRWHSSRVRPQGSAANWRAWPLRNGYDLIAVVRRADRLAALAAELAALGATTEPVVVDLAQPSGSRMVEAALAGRPAEVLDNDQAQYHYAPGAHPPGPDR